MMRTLSAALRPQSPAVASAHSLLASSGQPAGRVRGTHFKKRLSLLLAMQAVLLFCAAVAFGLPTVTLPGTTPIGTSTTQLVPVTLLAAGLPATVEVTTQGANGLDFTLGVGGSCSAAVNVLSVGSSCTVQLLFAPKYPGLRQGAVRIKDAGGNVLATLLVNANATGALPALKPGRMDHVAGSVGWIYAADNTPATLANVYLPKSAITDAAGNVFIADTLNNRIRKVDANSGLISTIAGNGTPTFSGDGGPAVNATVSLPAGLVLDGAGNLYFSDSGNSVVRRIDAVTNIITTVAGVPGAAGYNGSLLNLLATQAKLNQPESLAIDLGGNLLIADAGNNMIRKVDATTGILTTIAGADTNAGFSGDGGQAANAHLNYPLGVTVAADGSIYIADTNNQRVRRIAPSGIISTIAGDGNQYFSGDGGPAAQAEMNHPYSVALDPAGNIYIADSGNNRVREINVSTGNMETITGTVSEDLAGDGGPADLASFHGPYSLSVAQNGDLYITDFFHNHVRKINVSALTLQFPTMRVGKTSQPLAAGLVNDGNDALTLSAPVFTQSALDPATTTCTTSAPLGVGVRCKLGVEFAPTQVGSPITGSLALPSNVASITPTITLTGDVLSVNPTTVSVAVLAPSTNPSILGNAVTFQAVVSNSNAGALSGDVTFKVDGVAVCTAVAINGSATATCTAPNLTLGSHPVVAEYSGDAQDAAAVSTTYTQVVKQQASLMLGSTAPSAVVTKPVTLTATASAATGVPTGTVTFLDGSTTIGTAVLDGSGNASITISSLSLGTHSLTAQYAGDTSNAPATSAALAEVIRQGSTSTLVASSNGNVTVGQAVTLTATVNSLDALTPTGSVVFKNGSTTLGTATLTSGSAVLSLPNLAAGSYSIVATYSGDTDNATSSSAALTQTSTKLATATSVTTDAAPLSAGAVLHVTATVAPGTGVTAYGTLSGTVTLTDGSNVLGTSTVTNGVASFTVPGLNVATHTLTATYSGDSNYATSNGSLAQVVVVTQTNISLATPTPSILAGKTASVVATLSSATGQPTTSVTIKDGNTVLGQAVILGGVATFSTTSLSVGTHTLTAVYAGDGNYTAATSAPVTITVSLATPSVALTGPSTPVVVTTAANFQAALTTPGGAIGGTLTLLDGATTIAQKPVTAAGNISFSTTGLSLGQHTITVQYSGDANNAAATSGAVNVTVTQAATTTVLATSASPAVLNSSLTFTVNVTSAVSGLSGSVDLLDGATMLGSATLANGTATFTLSTLTFGDHSLTARYNGDTNHATSTSAVVGQRIIQSSGVTLGSSLNPSVSGNTVTFTAAVPGTANLVPSGSVVFKDGATVLGTVALNTAGAATLQTANLGVGTHTISASYSGDTNFNTSQSTLSQVVTGATTNIAVTVSADPAVFGANTDLTAAIQSNGSVATGTVQFTEGGAAVGTATLNASGVAVLHTTSLSPGRHNIVAVYAGDGKAEASTSNAISFLVKQQTTLTLVTSANPAWTLDHVLVAASLGSAKAVAATGSVIFMDGTTVVGTQPLDASGNASLDLGALSSGTHNLTATYAGDDADFAAAAPVLAQVVNLRPTKVTVTAAATNAADPQQVTLFVVVQSTNLSSVASPTGAVTLYNGTTSLGNVSIDKNGTGAFTVRLQTGATASITAKYAGDAAYAPSTSDATTVKPVGAAQFNLTVSSTALTVAAGSHTGVTITVASVNGFTDDLKMGCVGLPYAATCTFTQNGSVNTGMKLDANGSGSMQLMVDTGNPLGSGTEVKAQLMQRGGGAVLCLLPAGLLLLGKSRRKRLLPALLMLVAGVVSLGVTGCGGLQMNSTPAGTYTFQVTAVGQGTGATQSQTVTMTVGGGK